MAYCQHDGWNSLVPTLGETEGATTQKSPWELCFSFCFFREVHQWGDQGEKPIGDGVLSEVSFGDRQKLVRLHVLNSACVENGEPAEHGGVLWISLKTNWVVLFP